MTLVIQDKCVLVNLYVQPGAKVSQVCGMHGDRLKLKINSPPVDGRANQEVVEFFANLLKLPKREIVLDSGDKSRNKRVKINTNKLSDIEILRELYK